MSVMNDEMLGMFLPNANRDIEAKAEAALAAIAPEHLPLYEANLKSKHFFRVQRALLDAKKAGHINSSEEIDMDLIVTNAFSLNMLTQDADLTFERIPKEEVKELLSKNGFRSVVGHKNTAQILTNILGVTIDDNRETFTFDPNSQALIVAQYTGPRLTEGDTQLPEGAVIQFWFVESIDRS